jgi:hypothetical protein
MSWPERSSLRRAQAACLPAFLCSLSHSAAFNKVTPYNRRTLNHFIEQVTSFRMADKDASKREDDLLDAYTYGLSIALGDRDGW